MILWNVKQHLSDDPVSHPRNLDCQGLVCLFCFFQIFFFLSQSNILYADVTVFWSWRNSWWCVKFSKVSNNRLGLVRFEVPLFLFMEVTAFQDVIACVVKTCRHFREICCPRVQGCHSEDGFGIFLWNCDVFVIERVTSHPGRLLAPGFTVLLFRTCPCIVWSGKSLILELCLTNFNFCFAAYYIYKVLDTCCYSLTWAQIVNFCGWSKCKVKWSKIQ